MRGEPTPYGSGVQYGFLESGDAAGDYKRQQSAAWVAQKSMRPRIGKLAAAHGLIHGYIPDAVIRQPRWLGDRKAIEEITNVWNKLVIDRTPEMEEWIPEIQKLLKRGLTIYAAFNNDYGGAANESARLFSEMWERMSGPAGAEIARPASPPCPADELVLRRLALKVSNGWLQAEGSALAVKTGTGVYFALCFCNCS
jgi:hypothetical protein